MAQGFIVTRDTELSPHESLDLSILHYILMYHPRSLTAQTREWLLAPVVMLIHHPYAIVGLQISLSVASPSRHGDQCERS
ncbi:hypothetical protein ROHU_029664 [Labeo rohita]|uniref:Uncharacterized protein n=1 Tax=Labeo rohita TaxID=84645 RepID=A0A498LHW9_LABRO|nr:hypothetical protein ROHU_032725 [Labeo rohita]RXN12318.1 hypothetical protein ROHU_029664 [Labeo rohita]